VFGSDQALVGQFNDVMVEFVVKVLGSLPGRKTVWAAGERIQSRLADTDLVPKERFILSNSIGAIVPPVGQILGEMEAHRERGGIAQVYLFHNRPECGEWGDPLSALRIDTPADSILHGASRNPEKAHAFWWTRLGVSHLASYVTVGELLRRPRGQSRHELGRLEKLIPATPALALASYIVASAHWASALGS